LDVDGDGDGDDADADDGGAQWRTRPLFADFFLFFFGPFKGRSRTQIMSLSGG